MMSLSVDFYVRVFVRIYTSPAAVKDSGSKLMYVYQSQGCDSFYTQKVGRKVRDKSQLLSAILRVQLSRRIQTARHHMSLCIQKLL